MKPVLLIATGLALAYTIYLAWVGDAASIEVIVVYIIASLLAMIAHYAVPRWAGYVKWLWVAVSLATISAIFAGPLDYLRIN